MTAFKPDVASRATGGALNAAAAITESLERQLGKLSKGPPTAIDRPGASECESPWEYYCRGIFDAADYALAHNQRVIVITQPYLLTTGRARHEWQQKTMSAALEARYRGNANVRYVNAGPSLDIADPRFGYDGMHLTAAGNQIVASHVVEPVLSFASSIP